MSDNEPEIIEEEEQEAQAPDVREIDPDKHCEFRELRNNKLWFCHDPADYRILTATGKQVLNDANKWDNELEATYVCATHFDSDYKYSRNRPADGSWTYKKIPRPGTKI